MIKKHQPLINIAGHMHECPGKDNIKNTVCLNAGFRKTALVTIKGKKVTIRQYN